MSKVLIIGAGGVGTVVAHKVAQDSVFTDIMLASRTKSKCDQIAEAIGGGRIKKYFSFRLKCAWWLQPPPKQAQTRSSAQYSTNGNWTRWSRKRGWLPSL